jgi:hypothetical protein
MKKAICSVGLLVALRATDGAAGVHNSGFEAGDFADWTPHMDLGNYGYHPPGPGGGSFPAVTISIVSSYSYSQETPITPKTGNYFAAFQAGGQGLLLNSSYQYESYLSQSMTLGIGDVVSGWALFADGDYIPQDSAWVRILDESENVIATPWLSISGNNPEISPRHNTPWTLWQWQATAEGSYTIQIGASTGGDNMNPSEIFFDDIIVTSAPEPQLTPLLIGSLGFLLVTRFHRNTQPRAKNVR